MYFLSSTGKVRTLKWRAYEGHLSKFLPTNGPSLSSHIYYYYYYYYYYYGMAAQFPALASSIFSSQLIRRKVFSHNSRLHSVTSKTRWVGNVTSIIRM
jgi:hypothetical protein